MLFATAGQGLLAVWMMAAGAAMGLWYAAMAALRRFIRAGFILTLLCDLAWGAGCAAIFCGALVWGNYGRLRLYEVLCAALGLAMFALAVSPPLKRLETAARSLCRKIWTWLSSNRLIKVIFK